VSDPLRDVERAIELVKAAPYESTEWMAQALEDATVHVLCAPADLTRVQAQVDRLPDAWLYRVRSSPFVEPGTVLVWQSDGVLAPAVAVLPEHTR
jgi:hypothetical protein